MAGDPSFGDRIIALQNSRDFAAVKGQVVSATSRRFATRESAGLRCAVLHK